MELGIRTLIEFPDSPQFFREQLLDLVLEEAEHLELCLNTLELLNHKWGDWPVHIGLWASVSAEDDILDRILIVHRYLEGNGLDAGDTLIRRLYGMPETKIHKPIYKIIKDEIGHVDFGSRWYRNICTENKIDPQTDFPTRMRKIEKQVPKRSEKISRTLRKRAGFTDEELDFMEKMWIENKKPISKSGPDKNNPYWSEQVWLKTIL